jgi:hypothetical protein
MLNLEELRLQIRSLTREKKLYKLLKEELEPLGYWKNKRRGKPQESIQKKYG